MEPLRPIEEASLLAGLDTEDRRALGEVARPVTVKTGERLFRVGDEADTLFVLGRGGVELTLPLSIFSADREVVLQQLGAGATLAWAALVAVRVLAMGARATVDTELVGFGREDLLALFGARPALGYRVMTNLATIIGRRLDVTHALWIRELQRSVGERYR